MAKSSSVPISQRVITRRDFCKLALAAGLAAGCSASSEPSAIPTDVGEDYSLVAFCGIRCLEECPDHAYPKTCDGCQSTGDKLSFYCSSMCSIRKCALEKGVLTCAHCDDYPNCTAPEWTRFPMLKDKIQKIRNDLKS